MNRDRDYTHERNELRAQNAWLRVREQQHRPQPLDPLFVRTVLARDPDAIHKLVDALLRSQT